MRRRVNLVFRHSLTLRITPTLEDDYFILYADDKKKAHMAPLNIHTSPESIYIFSPLFTATAKNDTLYIPVMKAELKNKYLTTWWHQIRCTRGKKKSSFFRKLACVFM